MRVWPRCRLAGRAAVQHSAANEPCKRTRHAPPAWSCQPGGIRAHPSTHLLSVLLHALHVPPNEGLKREGKGQRGSNGHR